MRNSRRAKHPEQRTSDCREATTPSRQDDEKWVFDAEFVGMRHGAPSGNDKVRARQR